MPAACSTTKNNVEKQRRDTLNLKISEIQSIICPTTQDMTRIETLELAVSILTGNIISNSSRPNNSSNRKEYKKEHEQVRRNKEKAAYDELKKFIIDKKLIGSGSRLDKNSILTIIIDHLRSTSPTTLSAPPPSSIPLIIAPILPTPPPSIPLPHPLVIAPIPAILPTPPPTPIPTPPTVQKALRFSISSILQ